MTRYWIIAKCDPHNARFHFNECNNKPIRYDGATCVEWVVDDNYEDGYTIEEAYDILDRYADQLNDDTCYYDDDLVEQMRVEYREYEGAELDISWYVGAGWYENQYQVYKHGDESLRDDVMLYSIEAI